MKRPIRPSSSFMYKKPVFLGAFLTFLSFIYAQPAVEKSVDAIFITSVSPSAANGGDETLFEVKYVYNLESHSSGIVRLVANIYRSSEPFVIEGTAAERIEISRGSGSGTISAKLVPRKWSELIPFKIGVGILCTGEDKFKKSIVATDSRAVEVSEPREDNPVFANSKKLYEDGLSIISVSPESYVQGIEGEITVRVRYDLFSRENGEINLGTSDGRSNGYVILNRAQVKLGHGEVDIRCRFTPTMTGGLPFAKIFVNLSEYPHPKSWAPMANDEAVITILK